VVTLGVLVAPDRRGALDGFLADRAAVQSERSAALDVESVEVGPRLAGGGIELDRRGDEAERNGGGADRFRCPSPALADHSPRLAGAHGSLILGQLRGGKAALDRLPDARELVGLGAAGNATQQGPELAEERFDLAVSLCRARYTGLGHLRFSSRRVMG
jgi:hypothetical protein